MAAAVAALVVGCFASHGADAHPDPAVRERGDAGGRCALRGADVTALICPERVDGRDAPARITVETRSVECCASITPLVVVTSSARRGHQLAAEHEECGCCDRDRCGCPPRTHRTTVDLGALEPGVHEVRLGTLTCEIDVSDATSVD